MTPLPMQGNEHEARHEFERRKREWLYEDRYEPEPEPPFTENESAQLWRSHTPFRPAEFESNSAWYCIECHQPWANGGCSTRRALAILARRNAQVLQLNKRNRNMAEFLAEWFAKRIVGPGRNGFDPSLAECRLVVDRRMLEHGRMLVVDELLRKMRDQWKDYLIQLFPPSGMEVAARAFNESFANIEREKRRAQEDGE